MEQRRLLTFSVLVVVTWLGWFSVGPVLFPGLFPPPKPEQQVEDPDGPGAQPDGPAIAEAGDANEGPEQPAPAEPGPIEPVEPQVAVPTHPQQKVLLGSLNPATGYALAVELTSTGAGIVAATLNDPRYPVADNPDELDPRPQLRLLGNNLTVARDDKDAGKRRPHTFDVDIETIDSQFKKLGAGASLRTLDWELLETTDDPDARGTKATATFRIRSPDGQLEVRKIFRLNRIPRDQLEVANIRDTSSQGSQLNVELQIRNLSDQPQVATYVLQGPSGLPLENEENARKFRDVKAGFVSSESGSISAETLTAGQLAKDHENEEVETWLQPFRYIGVDTQYFAAIIVPAEPQQKLPWFSGSKPTVLKANTEFRDRSDISVELTSVELELPPDGVVEHRFQMFLGPKRRELLETYEADAIIDFGWFAAISHVMVWLLDTFHGWGAPYGVAIIMLTMIVRGCMFPISKKQALSAKKMKELQPQLMEIREKFKDDKQKLAQAQMELYRKASFNPLAGCLPVFLQLPIFIALYQALNNWVDLRMAPFLWVDNLAAPDALTPMPTLPFLGSDFNLLPILTVCLFYAQQKMFMPPPTTDEMAMQQKMMNFMMIFFGFLFYHVPAGLCVYFIASSVWGMSERKLLEFLPEKPVDEEALKNKPPKKDGILARVFKRLQEAAEMKEQVEAQRGGQGTGDTPPQSPGQAGGKRGGGKRGKGRR